MPIKSLITYCILTFALLLGGAKADVLLTQLSIYTPTSDTLQKAQDMPSGFAYSQTELSLPGFGNEPVRTKTITQPVSMRGGVFMFSQILHTSKMALTQLMVVNQTFVQHKSAKQLYGYYLFSLHKILI